MHVSSQSFRCMSPVKASVLAAWLPIGIGVIEPDPSLELDLLNVYRANNNTMWPKGDDTVVDEEAVGLLMRSWPIGRSSGNVLKDRFRARRFAVQIIEWLTRHQPELEALVTRVKRRTAYAFGLWPSHQQWSEVYNEAFWASAAPVHHDKGAKFWPHFAAALSSFENDINSGLLEQEYKLAPEELEMEHPESLHVKGMWSVIYVHDGRRCNSQLFPNACAALGRFAENVCSASGGTTQKKRCLRRILQSARFATLHPGTKVTWHTSTGNQRLKVHCGVRNPDNVSMTIANETVTWQERKCILLDDSWEHTLNCYEGQRPRTILEIKVHHPGFHQESPVDELDEDTGLPKKQRGRKREL